LIIYNIFYETNDYEDYELFACILPGRILAASGYR